MEPRRILVVDDEAGIRQALGQLLEYEGYAVRTASSGLDGLTEYDTFRPHLVFLDVKMAGIDGIETLRRLRVTGRRRRCGRGRGGERSVQCRRNSNRRRDRDR